MLLGKEQLGDVQQLERQMCTTNSGGSVTEDDVLVDRCSEEKELMLSMGPSLHF